MIAAGKMRKRIRIQTMTRTADGRGGFTESWTTVQEAWASVVPLNSREAFLAGQIRGGLTHEVRMRWTSLINLQARLVFDNRTLSIRSVENIGERNRELRLSCEEVQA